MELRYSIKELNTFELQVIRSIRALEAQGVIISGEHYLTVIKNLIEENKALRDEVVRKNTSDES